MQTNIKLVEFGKDLKLKVKKVRLEGEQLTPKQMQSVCKKLPIAATPYYEGGNQYILIEFRSILTKNEVKIDDWVIKLIPTNDYLELLYCNTEDKNAIAEIYKRSFLHQIQATKQFWQLDSPRIFYEKKPYFSDADYSVYRRFSISDIDMGYNGLGFAMDVSTAVFTQKDVSQFQIEDLKKLLRRQKEQKGTLLYRGFSKNSKCYYERYDGNITLGTAPSVNILGEGFSSPYAYYKEKQPQFKVSEHDKAVLVSFKNLENKVYVPANKVFLRIMNDILPNEIAKMDKINPIERRNYLDKHFWSLLGDMPFGNNLANIRRDYYIPSSNNSGIVELPNIIFKNNKTLFAPSQKNPREYKNHYRNRKEYLEKNKCFDVFGGNDGSNIFFIVPDNVNESIIDVYEKSITDKVHLLTGQTLEPIRITYSNYMSGVWDLKNNYDTGFVLFVFQEDINEPAVYYTIEQELGEEWNLKRATVKELTKAYQKWQKNDFDAVDRNWNSYIEMTTLSIIQRMNCTPFVVEASRFNYDMHLVIDVSEEGSHFALSAQIWNKKMTKPIFPSHVNRKFGKKRESINPQILEDELYKFLSQKSNEIKRYEIERLLILRDGKYCENENVAIENAFLRLKKDELLTNNFSFDFVEYHKTTRKEIRFWENEGNVLEGSFFFINPTMVALAATGAGTLNQGTSNPIILISKFSSKPNLKNILEDVFLGSQFNFSNPKVAQRETLTVVKADTLLQEKREQEIKRIR